MSYDLREGVRSLWITVASRVSNLVSPRRFEVSRSGMVSVSGELLRSEMRLCRFESFLRSWISSNM